MDPTVIHNRGPSTSVTADGSGGAARRAESKSPTRIALISVVFPNVIVTEAALTFLGVGLTEPTPSWGLTMSAATQYYRADPLYLWIPVLGVTILVLSLSLLGDAVRDAFDPRTRR